MDQEEAPTNGYGLRENPKKTRRLSSSDVGKQQRQCRDCGKLFRSWQALFGHMRCHSHHKNPEVDSWSVQKRKRMPRSSPPPEYEEEEQVVDVAISLMILSRDIGFWTTTFDSDKNSAVLVDSIKKKKKKKKSRYGCATCNKSFHSHQALGGHRAAAHKRGRGCLGDSGGSEEADVSIDDHRMAEDGRKAKGGHHQCGICRKVFASGQALGGHKRTHLVRGSATVDAEEAMAMPGLLDLNFPAPVDEFESWWAGSSLESEGMVGMIA